MGPRIPLLGHFHTVAELRAEVEEAGCADVEVHGLEGPNAGVLEFFEPDLGLERAGLDLVERAEAAFAGARRDLLAEASPHILAIGVR